MPGGHGKVPIGPNYLEREQGGYRVEDFTGRHHVYRMAR